jgi:squalene cyclase
MLTFLLILGNVPHAAAQTGSKSSVKMTPEGKRAVEKALAWLAKQQHNDGSWSDGAYQHNTAMTAFALLAFLSQGNLPGQGKYGPEVAKGARFLMAAQRDDGYLVGARGGNMYCHGMASLALAELWGNTGDENLKRTVEKAVDLIVRCQSGEGGWRYNPQPSGSDISVTIMQVMALRSARNSGLHVPDRTMKRAIAYINSCHHRPSGGYTYQPNNNDPGFARTAAGVCVLYLTGEYDAKEIPRAVEFLKSRKVDHGHYWYGVYYAAHAMYQVGGKDWQDWYRNICTDLLPKQSPQGSWNRIERGGTGPVYQTSIAVIVLSVPAHYLPIFQR